MKTFEGSYQTPQDARFAIVAGRFNHFITDRLVEGATAPGRDVEGALLQARVTGGQLVEFFHAEAGAHHGVFFGPRCVLDVGGDHDHEVPAVWIDRHRRRRACR